MTNWKDNFKTKPPKDDVLPTWDEVPEMCLAYDREEYAPIAASWRLLQEFGAQELDDLAEDQRLEFTEKLYHRYSACVQARISRGVKPEEAK